MTTTETRATTWPKPGPVRQQPTKPSLTFRNRLTRWDFKYSPYVYIAPFFILFALIGIFPIAFTAVISFQEWDLVRNSGTFVGFEQYIWILNDPKFWLSLRDTFSIFLLSTIPQPLSPSSSPRCSTGTSAPRRSGA